MEFSKPTVLFSSFLYIIICLLEDNSAQETEYPNPQDSGSPVEIPKPKDIFAVDPSFDVPVFNVTVIAGKTAILPCSVEYLGAHKVVWTDRYSTLLTYDIGRIIDDDRIGVERPFTNDWNLLIHDVKYSDAGKYVCQINTKPVKTKTVMLHVLVPPKIDADLSSNDIITREGQTVTLTCNVSGIPPPVVHWFRRPLDAALANNKEKLEPSKQTYYHRPSCTYTFHKTVAVIEVPTSPIVGGYRALLKKGVGMNGEFLIIHNISRYCDGLYECVAFNDVPPAVTKEIKVEVEFPPEIDLHTRKIGQSPGRETILECQITAFPMNLLVWRFNNQDLLTSTKHRVEIYNDGNHRVTLSLRVLDITYADYGNYTCFAQNKLGTDEDVMLLYDHRVREKATTTTTTTTSMTTSLKKTIWVKNPIDYGNSVNGNDKGVALSSRNGNGGTSKHSSILQSIVLIVLCCIT